MTAKTTNKISSGLPQPQTDKQESAKGWLARRLLKPMPSRDKLSAGKVEIKKRLSLRRPQTAPSEEAATIPPPVPPLGSTIRLVNAPPPRPPRPDSVVIRDVNAWLDASTNKPAAPIMTGLPYWREGSGNPSTEAVEAQFAVPIVQEPDAERPSSSHGQQFRSLYRRAKKLQVRMPSLQRLRSQSSTVQKPFYRRSTSTPLLGIPYEQTQERQAPALRTRLGSVPGSNSRPATANASSRATPAHAWPLFAPGSLADMPLRRGSPASARFGEPESNIERRTNGVHGVTATSPSYLRPVPATGLGPREDSMGSLSDAPTYFSGPPPPSYRSNRSRTASILTTSSFGCIDGMNPEQRQLSQQRAAQRRKGMKGKLKRMAQKANFTK